jgi:transcriptional regulatory protein RtcR
MGKNVVFGFLGTRLDSGFDEARWERWRPTVALASHENLGLDRLELLLTDESHRALGKQVAADIQARRPGVEVNLHVLPDVVDPWDFQQMYGALHDFASSYPFADGEQHYVHLTTGTHVAQICLFLLTEARYFPARLVETFSHGADVVWQGRLELIDLKLSQYDQLAKRFRRESAESQGLLKGGIVTLNTQFNALIGRIEKVALRSTAPVLLMGPTGAGKSALARRIHALRERRHLVSGAFVEVNCATLRGDNAMSTLFGHKKGAYTGAAADRAGLLKAADQGTLLLDEIGTLGLDEQAMLLCALEEKRFKPLGSDVDVTSNFQLLAGTNCDLQAAVAAGTFRADLLARLNVWSFTLPGLHERAEDIEPNVDYELDRSAQELGHRVWMTPAARRSYLAFAAGYSWPGNFRDLAASVMRMATLADDGCIEVSDVEAETSQMPGAVLTQLPECAPPQAGHLVLAPGEASEVGGSDLMPLCHLVLREGVAQHDQFDLAQLETVLSAIKATRNMAQAGRQLFGVSRTTRETPNDSDRVRKFLTRWHLDYPSTRQILCPGE